MKRRDFIQNTSAAAAGLLIGDPLSNLANAKPIQAVFSKKRLAIVGTGHRGTGFWGKPVKDNFGDLVEFVGLCDTNTGRSAYAKKMMELSCPTFTDFEQMMRETKPDMVIVTTVDSLHDQFIIKAMEMGADVITEKPMTTDELKCRNILAAEKRTGRKVIVGFNYRHGDHMMRIKELLTANRIGQITSVDFHWYLNVYHGADYFRRWHAYKATANSLFVHKASHHFDLLNWWLDSDPVEVSAYGSLDFYGKNGAQRGKNCRTCDHKTTCKFYKNITTDKWLNELYVKNDHLDGYLRDGCVFRPDIDTYDKMSAQIIYANGVTVNYSLTTYSPYEGWRIAFNGRDGRLESWEDIPYQEESVTDQASRHAKEMEQNKNEAALGNYDIMVMDNFKPKHEIIKVPKLRGGHGGGDNKLHNRIFRETTDNPLSIMAGTRDGAMACLIGFAARKSIEQKRAIKISELTDLTLMAKRSS